MSLAALPPLSLFLLVVELLGDEFTLIAFVWTISSRFVRSHLRMAGLGYIPATA